MTPDSEKRITVVRPGWNWITPEDWLAVFPELLEKAGRTCYKSEDRITATSAEKFVRGVVKSGHESVIEHCSITVRIICDRSCSHQLVRHRIAAYSQESQRYCDYGKLGFQVICPPSIGDLPVGTYESPRGEISWYIQDESRLCIEELLQGDPVATDRVLIWLRSCWSCYEEYNVLREAGIPPEDARSVLPNAAKTEVVTTYDLRQWRHVFKERALNKRAQWQIRQILRDILRAFIVQLPCVFGDLKEQLDEIQATNRNS